MFAVTEANGARALTANDKRYAEVARAPLNAGWMTGESQACDAAGGASRGRGNRADKKLRESFRWSRRSHRSEHDVAGVFARRCGSVRQRRPVRTVDDVDVQRTSRLERVFNPGGQRIEKVRNPQRLQ